jgi:archaeal type IV pilus assembly protein PilA
MNPQKRKAVSPVIATVILVAVAITVAVGVSYWMGGISSQYTQFEKVEVQTAICRKDASSGNWTITMNLKNSGTEAATLTNLFINGVEVDVYDASTVADDQAATNMTTSTSITSGATEQVLVYIDDTWETVSSGTTVNIKIHSAGGMDYIKLVELV